MPPQQSPSQPTQATSTTQADVASNLNLDKLPKWAALREEKAPPTQTQTREINNPRASDYPSLTWNRIEHPSNPNQEPRLFKNLTCDDRFPESEKW